MGKIKGICFRLDSRDRGHGSLNRYEGQKGFIFVRPGGTSQGSWLKIFMGQNRYFGQTLLTCS